MEKLEALDDELGSFGCETTLVPVDLKDLEKLSSLGPLLMNKIDHVDFLIGAAATLGQLGPLTHQPSSNWHEVWTVNFHSHWYLLKSIEPLLRQAPNPNIIFITSGLVAKHTPYWGAYELSKAALEAMAFMYAGENKNLNFKVNLFDPGIMDTHIFREAMPGADLSQVPSPESKAIKLLEHLRDLNLGTGEILR